MRDVFVQLLAPLEISGGFENVQFLQESIHSGPAVRGDFRAVQRDGQVRQILLFVHEFAKVASGLEEDLKDREAGLHVGLAVAARGRVPELQGGDSGAGHLQVADV